MRVSLPISNLKSHSIGPASNNARSLFPRSANPSVSLVKDPAGFSPARQVPIVHYKKPPASLSPKNSGNFRRGWAWIRDRHTAIGRFLTPRKPGPNVIFKRQLWLRNSGQMAADEAEQRGEGARREDDVDRAGFPQQQLVGLQAAGG